MKGNRGHSSNRRWDGRTLWDRHCVHLILVIAMHDQNGTISFHRDFLSRGRRNPAPIAKERSASLEQTPPITNQICVNSVFFGNRGSSHRSRNRVFALLSFER